MPPSPASVFIVDDDPDICCSLRCLLESQGYHVTTSRCASDFFLEYQPVHPACLILDYQLPGGNGQELLERLRHEHYDLPAIVITAHADVPLVLRLMRLGAVDVYPKPVDPAVLLPVISHTLALDEAIEHRRLQIAEARRLLAALTPRERELFGLLVKGRSYKEMATTLGISTRTVEHHRAHISAKLGTDRVTDLVRLDLCATSDAVSARHLPSTIGFPPHGASAHSASPIATGH